MSNKISRTVSDQEMNAMVYQESKGDPNAAPSTSSALGPLQFLKGTWREQVKKYRPDIFNAYTNGALLALRKNWNAALEIGARWAEANRRTIGANCTLGDLYLAHFLGVGTALKFYRAPMGTNAVTLAGKQAASANKSVFYKKGVDGRPDLSRPKTVGEIRKWSDDVMANASRKAKDYVGMYWTGGFKLPGQKAQPKLDAEMPHEEPSDVENVKQRPGLKPNGDYRLYDNQLQLRSMNYNPGDLDGVWGGGTAGAIAGFFNDYAPDAKVPLSWKQYDADYAAIDATIDKAESERFIRPVTKERDEADPELVEKRAPEIKEAKSTFWGGIIAFFGALSSTFYKAVEWIMGWSDEAERWGITGYLAKVPTWVWLAIGSAFAAWLVWKAWETIKGIEKPITTGERL